MNRRDAETIVDQGFTYDDARDLLRDEFDGEDAETLDGFTKSEVRTICMACIDTKSGTVRPKSHDALITILALMEFTD